MENGARFKPSLDPDVRLHQERMKLHYPWSISPFVDESKPREEIGGDNEEGEEEIEDEKGTPITPEFRNELKVKTTNEVPWIDLILEIAMTTALANLTNNTTISRGVDVLGYLCFWCLTWWAWASTVAYNVRFRQADWLHRWAAIFQLCVFGALAAFTQNFDITSGLSNADNPDQVRANQIMIELGDATPAEVAARQFQQGRLPSLNFRGIAMTMGWSRVLLLVQYTIVYVHALRHRKHPHRLAPAILVHIASLAISAACFFASFAILGHNPTVDDEIIKIILWYAPLLLELVAHFIPPALDMRGHVRYSAKGLYSRASVLFLIVLGQGLDSITGTFSYAVGPAGFGKLSVGLLISTATILIGQFSIFFGSPSLKKRCVRGLLWFFGQFVYTCALIVLISAVVNELIIENFYIALGDVVGAFSDVITLQAESIYNANQANITATLLNATMIPTYDSSILLKAGIAPTDVANVSFQAVATNSTGVIFQGILQAMFTVAGEFNLKPKQSDPLYWDFQLALNANQTDSVNSTTFFLLFGDFIRAHDDSVRWFPAAGGATFVIFAILRYIRQTPRDRWEWANIYTIGGAGIVYALLSFLDFGSGKPIINPAAATDVSVQLEGSPIFRFEDTGMVLPSYAILNLVVLIAIGVENYFARRSIRRKLESRPIPIYEPVKVVDATGGSPPPSEQQIVHWVEPARDIGSWTQHHHHDRQNSDGPWTDPFSVPRQDSSFIS